MGDSTHEIEVKLKVKDHSLAKELSSRIRAAKLSDGRGTKRDELNIIFDTSRNKLRELKQVLRLRTIHYGPGYGGDEGSFAELTFKDKGVRTKGISSRPETNIRIKADEAKALQSVLMSLGYQHSFAYAKIRTTYAIPKLNAVVEYDELPYIGDYIEIEAPDHKTIEEIVDKLNLQSLKRADGSYIRILKDKMKKLGIKGIYAEFEPNS